MRSRLFGRLLLAFPARPVRRLSRVSIGPVSATLPEIVALAPSTLVDHAAVQDFALADPDAFWATLARSRLQWTKDFTHVTTGELAAGSLRWFTGGELSVSGNCVDRHAAAAPDRTALIWEKDEPGQEERLSYRELLDLVCRLGNVLAEHGVGRGSVVGIYLPPCPMAVAAMLASARLGAIHIVVFAGFSADALAARLNDAGATVVVTADEGLRGGKRIPLKATVDAALPKAPGVAKVFVTRRTGAEIGMDSRRDFFLEKELESASNVLAPVAVRSADPLFMLHTSGSTGKPKGIVHGSAGFSLYASLTHRLVFDVPLNQEDSVVFGCMADIGWITGHSYVVYGPLLNGCTSVLFESVPTYPNPGRYWEMIERLGISHLYTSPTAVRLLIQHGAEWPRKFALKSLRVLGSVGEPINHEAWEWLRTEVGKDRCMLVDTWWQTETGGICIAPSPAEPGAPIEAAMAMRPMYGQRPVLLDSDGKEINESPASGALCLAQPWPGMAQTIHGDDERFVDAYLKPFPGLYCTGDGAERDAAGHVRITGRMDDVLNVSGHRLGTAEIEDALDEHAAVAESAVVGFPHAVKGEAVAAFVALKDDVAGNDDALKDELRLAVRQSIAAYAAPDRIIIAPGLPKTRSGKIMRRILRKIAAGEKDLGDISTLADPSIVQKVVDSHNKIM